MSLWLVWVLLAAQTPDFVEQGRKALEANRNDDAAALFQKAVAADPKDYVAHFHLALAEGLVKRDADAIAEYQKTLELKPHLFEAELNLGILFLRNQRYDDAIPHLNAAVEQKPAEYRPNYYLGEALLHAGKLQEAQTHLQAALRAEPNRAAAKVALGRTWIALNRLDQAEPLLREAATADPAFRDELLELADAQEKAGHKAEAIAIYEQFPENAAAQERMGELLIETKQFDRAIPRLEKAVAASPTAANRLALATAYRMNNQPVKELEQLNLAVAAAPDNYDLRMIYGRSLRDAKQPLAAGTQFFEASKIKPDSAEAWNELAGQLILANRYSEGLAALDKVRALGKELPGDIYLRAITLDKLHQNPAALESYKQFLAKSDGKFPDQEFAARQRIRIIEQEMHKR